MRFTHHKSLTIEQGSRVLFEMRLAGIAVDPDDRLLAVGDDHIKQFSDTGELEQQIPLPGLGWCVLAEDDALWVGMDGALFQLDREGKRIRTIRNNQLGRITSIAAVGDHLLLADATNRTIHEFTRDGKYLGEVGTKANTRGYMIPNGLLDLCSEASTETLLVAHPQKHRIERFNDAGELIDKWGKFGMHSPADFGGCCNPTNIAVAADGVIAVSEKAPPRVKFYSSVGEYLTLIESPLFNPNTANIDLAFDSTGNLYVSDPARRAIELFSLVAEEVAIP
ncbi:NHL repeat-containing protein [Aeoliella mucimassa]|uniref:NHL repeat protein n=1 Tax=Aeoliella mucimassa TaxID=2527972 RepID=A0A518AT64_9BACT|nr:hypothetical protein [Aeoliella mucimassa]QDU57896.1 hypothetical protein Pan181_41190 [Aeoliella mucimassa]